MIQRSRLGFALFLSLCSATLVGCPSNGGPDAAVEDVPSRPDRMTSLPDGMLVFDDSGDASVVFPDVVTPMDSSVSMMDAASGDVADSGVPFIDVQVDTAAMMGLDVPEPDVSLPPQPCSWVGPTVAFGAAGRGDRNVFVSSDMTGFAAGAAILRDGANNVWVQRVSRDGAPTFVGNVSAAAAGATVRGGAFIRDGMYLLTPWSQVDGANENVIVKRVQDNFIELAGSRQAVTTGGVHQEPQVALLRVGFMLAWRSVESGRGRIRVAPINGSTVGANVAITEASEDVASFKLITSQIAGVYAVAYRDLTNTAVRIRTFDATGASVSAPIEVATAPSIANNIDAVIEDDGDAWVTWAQPAGGGTIRLRRIGLAMGAGTAPAVDLATPAGAIDPGISLDGTNLAIAYRDLGAMPITVSLLRVSSTGTLIDRSQLGAASSGGRVSIEARSGRYGIGWSDDYATGAVTRIGVASCR
ncbi:MAG: hypothetical protein U0269_04875 [Polyangiales bacterium]